MLRRRQHIEIDKRPSVDDLAYLYKCCRVAAVTQESFDGINNLKRTNKPTESSSN